MGPFLLVSGDFVRTGGMDMANYALADYLARQQAEVHLVAHALDKTLLRQTVFFHRIPKPANSYFLASPLLAAAAKGWRRRLSGRPIRAVANGGNANLRDINWVHYVHAAYRPASSVSRLRRNLTHQVYLRAEERNIRKSQFVIANSEQTRRFLIDAFGLPSGAVHTVYYGTDAARFAPADEGERLNIKAGLGWPVDRPMMVFVGALGDRRKGFDTLFAAFKRVCASRSWDADLAVVGRGAELPLWQRRAHSAGLGRRIHFLGFRADVPRILKGCDVMLAPTRYEAYGLGVHEALCCGVPAVVSASAGVAERLSAPLRTLLLQDAESVEELSGRLIQWRAANAFFRRAALALSQELRKYSWDDMAETFARVTQLSEGAFGGLDALQ